MLWKDDATRYGLVTKCLHWSIAGGIVGLIALGAYMVGLTYYDPWYHRALHWHRAVGVIVLGLALSFLLWKRLSPSPALPASVPAWQRKSATAVHHILVLAMVLMPVTGYLVSTSAGQPIPMFGGFELPVLLRVGESTRDLLIQVHYYCAYGTLGLAAMHAGAAFKHQFVDRDGILARMLWR